MARRVVPGTGTLVLDSEGLSKAAARHERTAAFIKQALNEQGRVVVPAVTLAEVLRGCQRDAAVHHVLEHYEVQDITAVLGRAAGELLGAAGSDKTVDAVVAAVAADQPGRVLVLTSDVNDLNALTEGNANIKVVGV
jgi:predicted nucleic acid-binding protein